MLSRKIISASIGCSILLGLFGTGIAGTADSGHHFKWWEHRHHEQKITIGSNADNPDFGVAFASSQGELDVDCTSTDAALTNTYRTVSIALIDTAEKICTDKVITIYPGQHVHQKLMTLRHNRGVLFESFFFITTQSDATTGGTWGTSCVLESKDLERIGSIGMPFSCI